MHIDDIYNKRVGYDVGGVWCVYHKQDVLTYVPTKIRNSLHFTVLYISVYSPDHHISPEQTLQDHLNYILFGDSKRATTFK
jgi:hypothetical protein